MQKKFYEVLDVIRIIPSFEELKKFSDDELVDWGKAHGILDVVEYLEKHPVTFEQVPIEKCVILLYIAQLILDNEEGLRECCGLSKIVRGNGALALAREFGMKIEFYGYPGEESEYVKGVKFSWENLDYKGHAELTAMSNHEWNELLKLNSVGWKVLTTIKDECVDELAHIWIRELEKSMKWSELIAIPGATWLMYL